jgi:hypothetical protein
LYDDINDSLDGLFGGAPVRATPAPAVTERPVIHLPAAISYKDKCRKCNGSGRYYGPSSHGSHCFECGGQGFKIFKTSPEHRAKAKATKQARDARKAEQERLEREAAVEAWKVANPAEYAWLLANTGKFEFATSLWNALRHYGSLTPGQLGAVAKCIARDAARTAERQERANNAPAITVERIETAFAAAKASGYKKALKLRLDTFVFSPAKATSANPGAVYVKEGEQYLGKIMGGKFFATRDTSAETQARVIAAAADPEKAAVAYGMRTGSCSCCGAELTNGVSIERGIGPICATKWGW